MEFTMYLPLILLPLAIGYAIWALIQRQKSMAQHSDKNVGALASRIGLSVIEGDPKLNLLYFQQPMGNYQRQISLAGRPYGRDVEFWVRDGQKTREYVVATHTTLTFGSRLELAVPSAPEFEVMLRNPNQYLTVSPDSEDPPLPEVSTGVARLDEVFVVRAADPGVGATLVNALYLLASQNYVHMAGGSQRIWMKIERMALGSFAYCPEEYLLALETAACAFEGKPPPAALASPPQPAASPGMA